MKTHLPVGLRKALLAALFVSAAVAVTVTPAAVAADYPQVKEVTETVTDVNGVETTLTHTYINVGHATTVNDRNGVNLTADYLTAPDSASDTPIKNNYLHVKDGDLVGMFNNDEIAKENFVYNLESTYKADSSHPINTLNITNSLIIDGDDGAGKNSRAQGDLKISGSGRVFIGGKNGQNHFSSLEAKNVWITADATGTSSQSSTNLRADSALFETLTVDGGSAFLRANLDSGDQYYGPGQYGSWKSVGITKGVYINDGYVRMGRQGNGTSQTGGNRNQKNSHYMTCLSGKVIQTGGTLELWGKTYMNTPLVEQSGGTMVLANDPTAAYDYLNLGAASTTFKQTGNATMTFDGMICKGSSGTTSMQLILEQDGTGTINLNQGVMFKTDILTTENSLVKQNGTGKINLKGDYSSALFDIEQKSGTITQAANSSLKVDTAEIGGTVTMNGSMTVQNALVMGTTGKIEGTGTITMGEKGGIGFILSDNQTAINYTQYGDLLPYTDGSTPINIKLFTSSDEIEKNKAYALLTVDPNTTAPDWLTNFTAGSVTLSGTTTGQGNLANEVYWVAAEKTLYFQRTTDAPELTKLTWTGAESIKWNAEDVNWQQDGYGYNAGEARGTLPVEFADEGAGVVKFVGELTPESVTMNNSEGKDYTFAGEGSLTGGMKLTKNGDGKLTIQTANTYSGGTEIFGGTVDAKNSEAMGTGKVNVLSGATLQVSVSELNNDINLKGGTLTLTSSATTGALRVSGSDTSATPSPSVLNVASGKTYYLYDTIQNDGELTLTGAGYIQLKNSVSINATRLDTENNEGEDGFVQDEGAYFQMVNMGEGATLTNEMTKANAIKDKSGKQMTLDTTTGLASRGGAVHYEEYQLKSADATASVSKIVEIAGDNGVTETDINVLGGTLTVDTDTTGALVMEGGKAVVTAPAKVAKALTLHPGAVLELTDGNTVEVDGDVTLGSGSTIALRGDAFTPGMTIMSWSGVLDGTLDDINFDMNDSLLVKLNGNAITLMLNQTKYDGYIQGNWGIFSASRAFVGAVQGQRNNMGCIANGRGTAWVSVLSGNHSIDGNGSASGSDIDLMGAAFGADMKVGKNSSLGVAFGYVEGDVAPTGLSKVEQSGTYMAVYGDHILRQLNQRDSLELNWVAAYGQTESEQHNIDWTQDSVQLNARLTWNRRLSYRLAVQGFAGLEYFASESSTENGSKSGSIQNLRGELGVGVRYVAVGSIQTVTDEKSGVTSTTYGCERLVLHGNVRYINDMVRHNPVAEVNGWRSGGATPGRQGVGVDAGAVLRMNDRWTASAGYSFDALEDATEHRANIGVSYTF